MSAFCAGPVVRVAVGIISDAAGAVLIARRHPQAHQGGLWEFPGGKIEPNETVDDALRRELEEELGIRLQTAEPWLQISHAYADKTVLLEVWRVTRYRGEPQGREGQPLRWAQAADLRAFAFPAADEPIIARLVEQFQIAQQASSNAMSDVL
ncbi:MAG: 8-oxo-dGTP diphosphatase MutT [Candidatus Competibacteraceae bacterium]|nr:8-oxo-dGTP diphosphatase MutT [Candidatus Competibacteraceae bacterium]